MLWIFRSPPVENGLEIDEGLAEIGWKIDWKSIRDQREAH